MGIYGRWIYPRVTKWINNYMGRFPETVEIVVNLANLSEGTVLEIGVGTGGGLALYDPSKVSRVYGLDPHPEMIKLASEEADKVNLDVELLQAGAEEIPLENQSVDTIFSTATFCTIPDLDKALAEMHRVLRDNGKLIFLEHGRAPDSDRWVQRFQTLEEPLHKWMFQGCHLTRKIIPSIEKAGFQIMDLNEGYIDGFPKSWAYGWWGYAIKG